MRKASVTAQLHNTTTEDDCEEGELTDSDAEQVRNCPGDFIRYNIKDKKN